jgi:YD repeat-containing protein
VSERDANGNQVTYTWSGFAASIGAYVTRITDEVGRATTLAYLRGEPAQVCTGESCTTQYWYYPATVTDSYGRQITYTWQIPASGDVSGPKGFLTSARVVGSAVWQYALVPRGGMALGTDITDPKGNVYKLDGGKVTFSDGSTLQRSFVKLDDYNRQVTMTDPRRNATVSVVHWNTAPTDPTQNSLDDPQQGNLLSVRDPLANTTILAYDNRHNPTTVTDPLGRITRYEYSTHNLVTRIRAR